MQMDPPWVSETQPGMFIWGSRTNACSGADIKDPVQFLGLDRGEIQLPTYPLGHESMGQVKTVQFELRQGRQLA